MQVAFTIGKHFTALQALTKREKLETALLSKFKPTSSLSPSTLRNYQKYYKFMKLYPRFLRVDRTYSSVLTDIPNIELYLASHPELATIWKNPV